MESEKRVFGKTEQEFVRSGVNEYGMTIEKAQRSFEKHIGDGQKLLSEDEKKSEKLLNRNGEQVGFINTDFKAVQVGENTFFYGDGTKTKIVAEEHILEMTK